MTEQHAAAVEKVEKRIQELLIDLENEVGIKIEHVRVDTRNYANLSTEIFLIS